MLPRQHRLPTAVIKPVVRCGRGISGGVLRIKWAPARHHPSRATVVAGLSVDKRATKRNLVKRRLREAWRTLLPQVHTPTNLVVFANQGAVARTFPQLKQELAALLKRAHLL